MPHIIITELLTRRDKTRLVIELYKQEKTIREIAKEAHMSFGDISTIIKKEFESGAEDKNKEVQAFELFSKGLRPLDIIMKLNMKTDEVKKLYAEFQSLCGLERINDLCAELGEDIEPFYRLYKIMKEQGLGPEEIAKATRAGNDLPMLELKYDGMKEQVKKIEDKKQNLISEKENLESAIGVSRTVIANLDEGIQKRIREIESLDCKQRILLDRILHLVNTKEYKKVKEIASHEAQTILNDKRALLIIALVSVLEALKLDPEKEILISDAGPQEYYLKEHRDELLGLAKQIQDKLSDELIRATLNSVFGQHKAIPVL